MVEFWSLDLTSPIAGILVYTIAGLILLFFYLKVLPLVDRGNHAKVRLFLEATVIVIVITDILSFIIYPPAWNLGIVNDIFVYRQIPNGAHASSYVMVLSLVVIGFLKWDDALKGLMYAGLMVFIHEGMWFVPYYVTNWGDLNIPLDMAFVMWLLCITYISQKMYHLKVARIGYVVYGLFLLGWFMTGFEVTVKNTSRVFFRTPYYDSFTANAIEVTSWILVTAWFIYSLKLNGKGWIWFQTFKAGFSSLRRLNMDGISEPRNRLSSTEIKKRLVHVSIIIMIVLGLSMLILPVPSVHAGSVIAAQATGCASCLSASLTFTSVVAGDGFILAAMEGPAPTYPGFPATSNAESPVSKLTDGISGNDGSYQLRLATFTALASGIDILNVNFDVNALGIGRAGFFVAYEVRGINITVISSSTTGSCTCHEPVASFSGIPANAFTMGLGYTTDSASQTWSIGAGNSPSPVGTLVADTTHWKGASEYILNAGSSYTFDLNGATGTFGRIQLAAFAPLPNPVIVTSTVVVAPTVTSLNYWLFPFLFLGMYDSLYLASGLWSRVSTKGMIWLLMSGFVIGSMIAVIMGMLGIQLVVMTILALIIYWWRIH